MTYSEVENGEFNLDFGILVKTVRIGGLQAENKMKKNKKKNSLKHWCSDPRARPDPIGGSEPKSRDARLILFIFRVIKFSFSKVSRSESPARPEGRIRTGARFTPTFSIILSNHFLNVISP